MNLNKDFGETGEFMKILEQSNNPARMMHYCGHCKTAGEVIDEQKEFYKKYVKSQMPKAEIAEFERKGDALILENGDCTAQYFHD